MKLTTTIKPGSETTTTVTTPGTSETTTVIDPAQLELVQGAIQAAVENGIHNIGAHVAWGSTRSGTDPNQLRVRCAVAIYANRAARVDASGGKVALSPEEAMADAQKLVDAMHAAGWLLLGTAAGEDA